MRKQRDVTHFCVIGMVKTYNISHKILRAKKKENKKKQIYFHELH